MGTIQNSINQTIGLAATAVGMGKHIANQEKATELQALDAKEKAIGEYIQSNEAVQESIQQDKDYQMELNTLDRDLELYSDMGFDEASPQAMAFETAKQNVRNAINAKVYQDRLLKARMDIQDERWKVLGVDKNDLKHLNSPEERKNVKDFKKRIGGNK